MENRERADDAELESGAGSIASEAIASEHGLAGDAVSAPGGDNRENGDNGEESVSEEKEAPAPESLAPLPPEELRGAVEAVLFSLSEPVSIRALAELFKVSVHEVRGAVEELREDYLANGRAFRVEDIAGGVQILTLSRYDAWIRLLRRKEREGRLSPAALETLAVIAYKQPINKADLEAIRGVACGPILKTLLDRGLVQIAGRAETLGRPLLYGTTRRFLESFGLNSIRELPQPELEAKLLAEAAEKQPEEGSTRGLETTVDEGPGAN